MPNSISNIIARIKVLQVELENELSARADEFSYSLKNSRVIFQTEAANLQKQFKTNLWRYIAKAQIVSILTMPFIYALIVPFVILDVGISLYQAICFPAYKIPKVKRSEYMVFDRHHLGYLNGLEKLNCLYCSYGNGLLAYSSEIAARTEAYWCPIKHARKQASYHSWYADFAEFGDGANYEEDTVRNIAAVRRGNTDDTPASD